MQERFILNKRKRGSALITVLVIGAVLSLVGVGVAQLTSLEFESSTQVEEGNIALAAAEAGLEHGSLLYRYNPNAEFPYYNPKAANFNALDPEILACNKWGTSAVTGGMTALNNFKQQAIPSADSSLYVRVNLTQNKISKPFNIACGDDATYLAKRYANVNDGDTYYDLKIFYRNNKIGTPPADPADIVAKHNSYWNVADGYYKMLLSTDTTKGGLSAKKLAKDESLVIFFPFADTEIDTLNLYWGQAKTDATTDCSATEQNEVLKDIPTGRDAIDVLKYGLKYTAYERSSTNGIGDVASQWIIFETQDINNNLSIDKFVKMPFSPSGSLKNTTNYSSLVLSSTSAVKLTSLCKDIYIAVNACKGADCQTTSGTFSPNTQRAKFDTGELVIESIGHFGRTQKVLQKRINRSSNRPTEGFYNTLWSEEKISL